jgi:hypothetical protein
MVVDVLAAGEISAAFSAAAAIRPIGAWIAMTRVEDAEMRLG